MTMRPHVLALGILASLGLSMMLPAEAGAQASKAVASCTKVCDCNFECLDFCSTSQCSAPSACKRRVAKMEADCRSLCQRCEKARIKK